MTANAPAPCDGSLAAARGFVANPHPAATLAAAILGSSVAFIDGSVVNVALPAIGRDLDAGPAELSWTVNAYLLPLGALTLLGGGAGDHFGRRRLFLVGLAVFTLASVLCALAPSLSWLLAGRALQGVGAALLMPNSLAILGAAFSGEARGRAIGTWAAVGALAGAAGPLAGGLLVDGAGWRAIFLLNLPVAAAAGFLGLRFVTESREARRAPLDWTGALTATVSLGLLTWALSALAEAGASRTAALFAAAAGGGLLAAFVLIEARKGDAAVMPLALFATPTFVGLTLFTVLLYAALGGLLVLLPFLLIRVEGYSALAAGAAILPLPIAIGLGSPLIGRLTARSGARLPLAGGAALTALGLAAYLRVEAGGVDYWRDMLPATVLVALGMAVSVAPLTTAVMGAVDSDHVGAASGFNSAVARIAGLVATALSGFVFALDGSEDRLVAGFRTAALVGAGLAALAAACAFLLIASRRPDPPEPAARPVPG